MTKKSTYRFTLLTIIRIFAALMLAFASPSSALAAVWTDQQDYSPGSVVTISGDNSDNAGYLPGETVNVNVTGPNDYTATCSGVADGNGAWSCQITLWDSLLAVGDYAYTATGQTSGVVQSGAFTDAQGAYSFDFSAADPGDIPTYPKVTPAQYGACPAPSGGTGRAADPLAEAIFGNPVNSVESLAPEDMILGQIVPFETEIKVNGSVAPENGRIRIVQDYLARTTNGGNFGYDTSFGLYCAFIDTADAGNASLAAGTKVESYSWTVLDPGTNNERIRATIIISGLVNPETVILETWVVLKNTISAGITGNVQSSIVSGQTCTNPGCTTGGNISVGNQTIPLLRVQEFFTSDADLTITKSDSPDPVLAGSQLTYSVQVTNNGPATANNIVVTDTLDANTSFVASSLGSACTPSGSNIVCNLGGLAPGQSTTFTITVNVSLTAPTGVTSGNTPATGTCTSGSADLCNQVTVRAITNDPNTANNSDSEPTNVLPLANLQIVKNTVGGDDTFSFAATGSGLPANFSISTSGGTGSQTYTNLVPGARTITEQNPLPAGWSFTNLTCVDPDSGTAVSGQTATVDLDSGETVVCTYTNAKGGSITIVKNTVGGNGTFEFTSATLSNFAITTSGGTGNQAFSGLAAGTYDVSETVPTGWDLTSATCSDGSNPTSIGLSAGENVTCTFTNTKRGTIIVEKQTDPDGAAGNFTFTGTAAGTISDGGQIVVNNLIPGTYTATENNPGPTFALTSITCNDANSSGDASTRTATFQLEAGETVKCTFTNTQQAGTLIVKKVVTNDHGGTKSASDFSFVVNGGSPVAFETDGQNELSVSAGVYNIIEPAVAGYTTTYNNCANVNVPAGGSATCTITNDDQPGTLIVKKIVINDNGGTLNAEAFSFSVNGGTAVAFEADGQNHLTVNAGTYSITEPAVAGYSTTYDGCSNVEILNGGSATCTITNDDNAGTLIVKKVVINDNGGTLEADDFSFSVNGDSPIDFEADGQNNLTVNAGTYNITEPAVAGYTTTYDTCSNVVIPNGGSATCTITNDDQPGTLIVKKVVMNDNGGTLEADDFSFSVNGGTAVAFEADGENSLTVNAGMYTITETAVAGYSTTYNNCSNVVITNGGTATCTITNNDVTAHLSLIKQVTNDNGGDANAMDWTLSASGPTPISGAGGAEGDVNAGIYTLSEAGGPSGYTAGAWVCVGGSQSGNQVTLANGESATCTIINNDVAPTLTLIKNVVNNNGGAAGPNDFGLSIGGNPATSGTPYTLDANTPYVINEAGLIGYAFVSITGDAECPAVLGGSVTLDEGENITCTITNDDIQPKLIVIKLVVNDNGGALEANDFTITVTGNGANPASFPGSETGTNVALNAGAYSVTEVELTGYTTSYSIDCTGTLAVGQTKTCTITNDDQPGTIIVEKQTSPDGLAGNFTFTGDAAGTIADGEQITVSGLSAGAYTSSEVVPAGWQLTSIVCSDGNSTGNLATQTATFNLENGETVKCVFTNDPLPTVTLIKTADPTTLPEPGGDFDFTVIITNTSPEPVTIDLFEDNQTLACDYLEGQVLNAGESVTCVYTISHTDAGSYNNTASVIVKDNEGNSASAMDEETVTVTDALPTVNLVKSVDDNEKPEPGGVFNYTLTITNNSVETVEITALTDTNALSAECLGLIGITLTPGQSVSCTYSVTHTDAGSYPNTASVTVEDNENNPASDSDTETVTVTDVLPTVDLVKSVDDNEKPEPGGVFNFTLTITNISVEDVTITALTDTQAGVTDFSACNALIGTSLNPGQSVSCTYSVTHTDAGSYPNTASVTVADDEGNPASDSDTKTVTVTDVAPQINVEKTANPTSVPETGGNVTFTFVVTNNSVESVSITELSDSVFGTLAGDADCKVNTILGVGASCTFDEIHFISDDYPGSHTNTFTAKAEDNEENVAMDADDATVAYTDVLPDISVSKTASPTTVPETGGNVLFTFVVTNNSTETATITGLSDDKFGTLAGDADCQLGTVLASGASCSFSAVFLVPAGDYPGSHVNTFTATVQDDDGNEDSASDDETVTYTDVLPDISVIKTANPTSVPETGANVTFTFTVANHGPEAAIISSLSDSVYGTLTGDADCQIDTVLASGASCEFSITRWVAGDFSGDDHYNVFTGKATDNDGNEDTATDDETVTFTDVLPDISVSKTASPTSVPETGGNVLFTFVVTNHNSEAVTLTSLTDSDFGNLNGQGTCATGGTIAGNGGTYTCSFTKWIAGDFESGIPHENTATAVASDDDGNSDTASDDAIVTFTDVTADIVIDKVTMDDTASGDGLNILIGESIKWRYTVTNAGNYPLSNISVTDSVVGVTPTYVSGDTNSNDKLDLTETWIYEASGTAITGNYSNTGTASGNFTDGAGNVESDSASDTSSYFGADPQLIINKVTVDGATASDGLNILTGEPIQWRYTITNTGNVLLSNVTVTDSVASVNIDCDGGTNTTTDHIVASLAVGASVTCVANGTAITGNYSNLGTASGRYTDSGGHTRTDAESDASSYFGANPQIDIVKTTVGTDGTIGDNVFVITGGAVTWRYVVTNTGNVALSGPVVTDTVAGVTPIFASVITGDADGLFEPGEVWLYTATGTNNTPAGMWYSNTGWASGSYTDSAGHTRTPTDSDTSRFYSGTPGAVTNSSLCDFGPNFRLVFTPDSRFYTSSYQAYKLSDSNPGQFFYNVFYTNPGSTSTVRMEIPYPFVTQGAMPVHVYGGLTVNDSGSGTPSPDNLMNCFVPGNTLAAYGFTITLGSYTDTNGDGRVGFGDVVFVNVPATSGFQYINIHLDYGLEKTDGWVKQGSNAITDQTKYPGRADIRDLTAHTFKAYANSTLIPGSTDTVYNQNEFKQVRGFGGLVYTWHGTLLEYVPLAGAKVRLYKGTTLTTANLLETMTADNDGWYLSTYVHKGKAATYTLALLDASGTTIIRTIQVIAGGSLKFGEGNFRLGGPTPNP